MGRVLPLIYGVVAYLIFLVSFLYAIGFVGNFIVPKSIDSGQPVGLAEALIVNLLLLGLFAVQHTVMARPAFKRVFTKVVPEPVERSTFVLASSLILLLLYWQWRPMPTTIWDIENPVGSAVMWILFWFGWAVVFVSTYLIDHFDLFGLRQVYLHFARKEYHHVKFTTFGLYKVIRHPIMLGFIIAFWATPHMTLGHLIFAIGTTGYIIIGVHFEEHDLRNWLGEDYERYQQEVPMLCPFAKVFSKKTE